MGSDHDHISHGADLGVTVVFVIVLIAALLLLRGTGVHIFGYEEPPAAVQESMEPAAPK